MMFLNNNKDRIKMLSQITFTSKASLKKQCLCIANYNIKEAKELYEFLMQDLAELPDTDPIPATWQDNTKNTVNGLLGWLRDNKDTLIQGYDFIRSMISRGPSGAVSDPLPPINDE